MAESMDMLMRLLSMLKVSHYYHGHSPELHVPNSNVTDISCKSYLSSAGLELVQRRD